MTRFSSSAKNLTAALCATLLAACSSNTPAPATPPEPTAEDAAVPVETATVADASAGAIETLYVHSARVDCTGEIPRKCLQIRKTPTGEWERFYSRIAGFTYEEGHSYELRVEVTPVEHPPADGSSLRYRLIEIVSKH